jgi:hypothetical protein
MSGEQLRDELRRIAESTPTVHIPSDTYARGRRAARRARVLVVAATVGCLALLAALVVPLVRATPPQVTDGKPVLGVPDHLYATSSRAPREEPGATWDIVAAAVLVDGSGRVTLVDAADGSYHPLDVSLRSETRHTGSSYLVDLPIALSPDGTQLAWAWLDDLGIKARTAVRILDLTGGSSHDVSLTFDTGSAVIPRTLRWSPDSRRLAWSGYRVKEWNSRTIDIGGAWVGSLDTRGERSTFTHVPEPAIESGGASTGGDVPFDVAVSDRGELAAVSGNLLLYKGARTRFPAPDTAPMTGLRIVGGKVEATIGSRLVSLPSGDVRAVFPDTEPTDLGLLDRRHVLHLTGGEGAREVQIVSANGPGRPTPIIEVDRSIQQVSLATDLMSLSHPTVHRPAPEWPWWTGRVKTLLTLSGLLLVGLLVAVLAWRQRRAR